MTQNLFIKSPSSNPFLAQSLLEDKAYMKYYVENNILEREKDKAIEISKEENMVYDEDFEESFDLTGYFSLIGNNSINSADIDISCNYLAICCSEDILIYDISVKSKPRLLNCVKNTTVSIINKVKFSHSHPILYFCD